MKCEIYNKIKKLLGIERLYLVGGAVRDIVLGYEPNDYDFSTNLSPDEIEQAVRNAGRKPYLIGKKFGTIGFKNEGDFFEVTTFRNEKYQKGNRKPEVVFTQDIVSDLSRRDFTINAMALRDNKLIDPFGGIDDISNRCIRFVGNSTSRIKEDPLRILRAARLASRFKFSTCDQLSKSCTQKSYKILEVSKERWCSEIDKILLGNWPSMGLFLLMEWGIFNYIIPELSLQKHYDQNSRYHDYELWTHTRLVVQATPPDINLRWAALLHDVAKPFVMSKNPKGHNNYIMHELLGAEIVDKTAKYLKWSNDRRDTVKGLVKNHLSDSCELRKYDNMAKTSSNKQ